MARARPTAAMAPPRSPARRLPWRAASALLLLDLVAAPSVYWLCCDVRGDVAAAAPSPCTGDCDLNGFVSEGDLLTAIAIALEDVPLDRCTPVDTSDPGRVTVDELVQAVAESLGPCRFTTATITPTLLPETPISNARVRRTPPPR